MSRRGRNLHAPPSLTGSAVALLGLLAWGAYHVSGQQSPPKTEYEVKAALLLNFARFIQWPEGTFAATDSPIVIGVLGDDPFGSALDEAVKGAAADSRPLVVRRSRQIEHLRSCHMIFISRSERDRLGQVLGEVNSSSIVTISEVDGFTRRGGIINFYFADEKVRFEINPEAAQRKKIRINAQLLARARITGD